MKNKFVFMLAALVMGGVMMAALGNIHEYGAPLVSAVDDYYLAHANVDISALNVVTSIVFDYRGFDTIGESTVLFAALGSIAMLFRKGKK